MQDQVGWEEKNIEEAFFPVELSPVYADLLGPSNALQRLDRHFAVMDVERRHAFAVVTDDYKLITNRAAYELSSAAIQRVFQATTLQDLACLNIVMPKSRSFCHIDLIRKGSSFQPFERDSWTTFLRITNSYNRTRRLRFELGFCRWVCMNGMIFGSRSIEFSYAHTRRGMETVSRFHDNIGEIRRLEARLIEHLHHLKRFYVPREKMLAIFCRAFQINVEAGDLKSPQRSIQLFDMKREVNELVDHYFGTMGPHGYAALNVLTEFASRPSGVISPEASIHSFQQKTSNWMEDFIKEISKPSFSFESYLVQYSESAQRIEGLLI